MGAPSSPAAPSGSVDRGSLPPALAAPGITIIDALVEKREVVAVPGLGGRSYPPFAGFCTDRCYGIDANCAYPNLGGTAEPKCNDSSPSWCYLDCSGNKTCPGGMACIELLNGTMSCY